MDNDSTCNLRMCALRLGVALICGTTALAVHAAPITTQGSWWGTDGTDGTLQARDIDGNAVALNDANAAFFYDTDLDITWLANWNAGAGSTFDDGSSATDGRMTWNSAMAWAANLMVGGYGGWRLPTALNADGTGPCAGFNCTGSEMGHLYYVTLGNPDGGPLDNTAYFTSMQSALYWFSTEHESNPNAAWQFFTTSGSQTFFGKSIAEYAVAVRSGDVLTAQAVPEPGTLALLLAALGVGTVVRRRRAH